MASSASENSADPKIASAGPSQATGRVQPRIWPTLAITASSSSSAPMTSHTWTGPAACRNVPHVVDTGNTRQVNRKVTRLYQASGRSERLGQTSGIEMTPRIEIGIPSRSSTLSRLWRKPTTRSSSRACQPNAR